jgi:hypothetical protein
VNDSDNSFVAHRMLRGESGELGAQGFPRLHSHPEERLFTLLEHNDLARNPLLRIAKCI